MPGRFARIVLELRLVKGLSMPSMHSCWVCGGGRVLVDVTPKTLFLSSKIASHPLPPINPFHTTQSKCSSITQHNHHYPTCSTPSCKHKRTISPAPQSPASPGMSWLYFLPAPAYTTHRASASGPPSIGRGPGWRAAAGPRRRSGKRAADVVGGEWVEA